MEWIDIRKEKPPKGWRSYFISGHEWFGIGYWKDNHWHRMLFAEFPTDFPDSLHNENDIEDFSDDFVMFWAKMPDYPTYWED